MNYREIEELAGHRPVSAWVIKLVNDAIAIEREACAKVAENGRFLHDDSPEARFGKECAAAIRTRGQE